MQDKSCYAELSNNLVDHINTMEKLSTIDDKQFYWLFHQIFIEPMLDDIKLFSRQSAIIEELQNRLVPEYDGETYYMTETGWITPNGEINYIKRLSNEQ